MRAEPTLKKKHISMAYHQAREAVAGAMMLVFYEKIRSNHADLFTKVLNHINRKTLMGYICGKGTIPGLVPHYHLQCYRGKGNVLIL